MAVKDSKYYREYQQEMDEQHEREAVERGLDDKSRKIRRLRTATKDSVKGMRPSREIAKKLS